MNDEWFADKFIEIAEDLGEIKADVKDCKTNSADHEKRVRKLEKGKSDSNKKLVGLITAISTGIASIIAGIALIFQKVS